MKHLDSVRNKKTNRKQRTVLLPLLWLLGWLFGAAVLSGCASTSGGVTSQPDVGPVLSSAYGKSKTVPVNSDLPKIDVVVPVFDPNLPKDTDSWEKQGIFPELRRAESNRFALKMKSALEDTDAFGAVRVAPNTAATSDLYVIGKIIQSNGEDVKINITVADISGKQWFSKDFKHRAKESFHNNIRNKGKDAYDPVFEKAASYIVKQLNKSKPEELDRLSLISEMRFGSSLSEETFTQYLKTDGGRIDITAVPADNDPAVRRIKAIRVRDQLFIDNMQTHYTNFDEKMNDSYLVWQQQSLVEVKAARKTKTKSVVQGVLGGLLLVAGVVAAADADNSVIADVAATGAIVGGAIVLGQSFQTRAEMKFHRDALAELGQSLDIEIAPQVVEYENQTAELVGDAAQQYTQWIAFLKKTYELEATPGKQL